MKEHIIWLLDSIWPTIIISSVIIVTLRIWYIIKNKVPFLLYHELIMLSFAIYIMCLFYVVTFPDAISSQQTSFNLIPFKEMFRYDLMSRLFIKNVLGNLFMFIPLGFYSAYIIKMYKLRYNFIFLLIVSLTIEFTQLAIGRVFDIDDILLNLLGGCLGFYLYLSIHKIKAAFPKFFGIPLVYNTFTILALILFAFLAIKIVAF